MKTLLAKIHAVRSEGLTVAKTGKISGGINALFASYPDVWAALYPALQRAELSVGFSGAVITVKEGVELVRMALTVSDGEAEKTAEFDMIIPEKILNSRGSSVVNNAQRVANAESYTKRTALIHFFGMSAGNEDEVERMTPRGDETNIPGAVVIGPDTPWQDLTDGGWANGLSPSGEGLLSDVSRTSGSAMAQLWTSFPNHPGICAWAADWITSRQEEQGIAWEAMAAADPALPGALYQCNAAQLRAACKVVREMTKGGAK